MPLTKREWWLLSIVAGIAVYAFALFFLIWLANTDPISAILLTAASGGAMGYGVKAFIDSL